MSLKNPFDQHTKFRFKYKVNSLRPLGDTVIVSEMDFSGRKLSSGIVLLGDDGKSSGIRSRWAQVFAVGPEQTDVKVGEWICIAHGRWSRGIEIEDENGTHTIRKVDTKDILLSSDNKPDDDTISDAVVVGNNTRD
jgi:co-chaperonin GroES (HSP10)